MTNRATIADILAGQIFARVIKMFRFVSALSTGAIVAAVLIAVCAPASIAEAAMSDADKATLNDYTATCRAEIKEQATYQEMWWYVQHKAVKNCVKDLQSRH